VNYYECSRCGYVQTEQPSWLDEAYANSINLSDTGILARNLSNVGIVLSSLMLINKRDGIVLDFAGGYGILVRLLRDIGVDAYWEDPYSENLLARGFEYPGNQSISLVTAFESFEHFLCPQHELERLISYSSNILFTTNLIPRPSPSPNDWWYYGLEHGQHIGFYRIETLHFLAHRFGLNLLSDGLSTHFFTKQKIFQPSWRFLTVIGKRFPSLFRGGLRSKTWSDHLSVLR